MPPPTRLPPPFWITFYLRQPFALGNGFIEAMRRRRCQNHGCLAEGLLRLGGAKNISVALLHYCWKNWETLPLIGLLHHNQKTLGGHLLPFPGDGHPRVCSSAALSLRSLLLLFMCVSFGPFWREFPQVSSCCPFLSAYLGWVSFLLFANLHPSRM